MTTTYRIQFADPDVTAATSEVIVAPDFTTDSGGNWLPPALAQYAQQQSKMHLNDRNYCAETANGETIYRRQTVSIYAVTVGSVGRKCADAKSHERLLVMYSHVRIQYAGSEPIFEPQRLF